MIFLSTPSDIKPPSRKYKTDVGIDLFAPFSFTAEAKSTMAINTRVKVEQLPYPYWILLATKSSTAAKGGVVVGSHNIHQQEKALQSNEPYVAIGGIIDSGYTGSIYVTLYNTLNQPLAFTKDKGICQMILMPVGVWGDKLFVDNQPVLTIQAKDRNDDGGIGRVLEGDE